MSACAEGHDIVHVIVQQRSWFGHGMTSLILYCRRCGRARSALEMGYGDITWEADAAK